ncbi:MAG: flagellar protein FlgN [Planctomycetota bacterium]
MDRNAVQNLMRLEDTLNQSVERQGQLATLLERKRTALRRGAVDEMTSLCRLENAAVQTISELEKRRLQLVADLTLAVEPGAAEPLKMRDLAERLPEPHRGRLLLTRQKLVDAMQRVQQQTTVTRRASESLLKHMNGLIRTIGVVSQGGAAYGQTGRVSTKPAPMASLNLTA